MEQQLNSSTGGWIGDDRRDEADFTSVSQTIAKPNVSRRAWLFQGTNEKKFPITIYVSAVDRESAIAHFETDYPQYNWFATVECALLCG
jgi:hypothetical protein